MGLIPDNWHPMYLSGDHGNRGGPSGRSTRIAGLDGVLACGQFEGPLGI